MINIAFFLTFTKSFSFEHGTGFKAISMMIIHFFILILLNQTSYSEIVSERNCNDHIVVTSEINLTVLTHICDQLSERPISLKVYVDGGTPGYSIYAGGLLTGKLSENEFVILGLHGGEGVEVTVTDASGSSADFWAEAFIMPSPGAEAGPPKLISCSDSMAILNAYSPTEDVRYYWSGPDTDFELTAQNPGVDIPGIYHLTVTSMTNGCQSYDSTFVFPSETPEFGFETTPVLCYGDSSGTILFNSMINGTPPYEYSIDNGSNFQNNPSFNEVSSGTYHLIIRDQLGCKDDTTVVINEADAISLELGPSLFIHYGEKVKLDVETNLAPDEISKIIWSPKEGLSCHDCLEPIASPENSVHYSLEIISKSSCSFKDTIFIEVEKDLDVYIPNVFSPNGDGINDIFYVKGENGVSSIKSLEIFDRWGNMVFHGTNLVPNESDQGWDGKYKGHYVSPGVFVFKAEIVFYNTKEKTILGDLTLLR